MVRSRARRLMPLLALGFMALSPAAGARTMRVASPPGPLVWSPYRQVLTLSGAPDALSPLVVDAGRKYVAGAFGGRLDLLTDAGGTWHQYGTGVPDYLQTNAEGYFDLAVSAGVAYIPYMDRHNDLRLAFDPGGPAGAWREVTVVPFASHGASCGLGNEPGAPVAAVVSDVLAVGFDDAGPCHGGANTGLNVYVATTPVKALGASGSSPKWQISAVTASYPTGGSYPALGADGHALDLTYQLDNNSGAMAFVQGTPAAAATFAWPAKALVFTTVSNQGMDRPKMFLIAGGQNSAGVQDGVGIFAGGNVVDAWAATRAAGRWTAAPLSRNLSDGGQRPAVALSECGPAVSYQVPAPNAAAVVVAARAGSRWVRQLVGPAESSRDPMWPQVALTAPDAVQLLFFDDDSGSTVMDSAVGYCRARVLRVAPPDGPAAGGTTVTITGRAFDGATAVSFGQTAAPRFTVISDTTITATSPKGSGRVAVTVTTGAGSSSDGPGDVFRYTPPNG